MNRFNSESGDDEDIENYFDDMDEIAEQLEIQQLQIDLVDRDMNHRLLGRTIKFLERGFFWRFLPNRTKLRMISKTFKFLRSLTVPGDRP